MGAVGVVRLSAAANHSSEKERMREPRGLLIRSMLLEPKVDWMSSAAMALTWPLLTVSVAIAVIVVIQKRGTGQNIRRDRRVEKTRNKEERNKEKKKRLLKYETGITAYSMD
jgi:hypothetical protein